MSVLASVVHRSESRRRVVIDAGAVALSKDSGASWLDERCGFGRVVLLDGSDSGLRVSGISQEHGVIDVGDRSVFEALSVGSRVRIVPNHSCLTVAQHSHFNVVEDGRVVDRWVIHGGW